MRGQGDEPIRLVVFEGNARVASALTEAIARHRLPWRVAAGLRPDDVRAGGVQAPGEVVVVDFTGSARFGFERAWAFRTVWARVRVLGVSEDERFGARLPWLRLGCHGAWVTSAPPADLLGVVEQVHREGFGLCSRAKALLGSAASEEPACWAPGWKDLLDRLHDLMVAGDPEAPEVLVGLLRQPLLRSLAGQFRGTDEALLADAVTDALLDYLERPSRFDRRRGKLEGYLRLAARRNLSNCLQAKTRRQQREQQAAKEELLHRVGRGFSGDDGPEAVERETLWQRREEALEKFLAGLVPEDRAFMDLWLQGERRTEEFAKVLGIAHRPLHEQRVSVHRAKKRLRAAVQRLAHTTAAPDLDEAARELFKIFRVTSGSGRNIQLEAATGPGFTPPRAAFADDGPRKLYANVSCSTASSSSPHLSGSMRGATPSTTMKHRLTCGLS